MLRNKWLVIVILIIFGACFLFSCSGKTVNDEIKERSRESKTQEPFTSWYPLQDTSSGNIRIYILDYESPYLNLLEFSLDGETYTSGKMEFEFSELTPGTKQAVYCRVKNRYLPNGTRYIPSEPHILEVNVKQINPEEEKLSKLLESVIYSESDKTERENWIYVYDNNGHANSVSITSSYDLTLMEYNFVAFSSDNQVGDVFSEQYRHNWKAFSSQEEVISKYYLISNRQYEGYIRYKGDDVYLPSSYATFQFYTMNS